MFRAVVKSLGVGEKSIDAALERISLLLLLLLFEVVLIVGTDVEMSMMDFDTIGAATVVVGKMILAGVGAVDVSKLLDDCGFGRISRGFLPFNVGCCPVIEVVVVVVVVVCGVRDAVVLLVLLLLTLLVTVVEMSRCSESSGRCDAIDADAGATQIGLGARFDLDLVDRLVLDLDGLINDVLLAVGLLAFDLLDVVLEVLLFVVAELDLMGDNDEAVVGGAVITFRSLPFRMIAVVGGALVACVKRP